MSHIRNFRVSILAIVIQRDKQGHKVRVVRFSHEHWERRIDGLDKTVLILDPGPGQASHRGTIDEHKSDPERKNTHVKNGAR